MILNRTSPGINKPYEPLLWNDTGVYSYFYIDFLKDLAPFTIGMWNESIVVYDSVAIAVTAVEKISARVYKVYANITNFPHGYTVLHKKTTRLTLPDGSTLAPFSIHAFVTGQIVYLDGAYVYDLINLQLPNFNVSETMENLLWTAIDAGSIYESASLVQASFTAVDTFTINLT